MNSFAGLLSPLVLLFAGIGGPTGVPDGRGQLTAEAAAPDDAERGAATSGREIASWLDVARPYRDPAVHQVRIEQRIIMRISPRPGAARQNFAAQLQRREGPVRFLERPIGDCIPMAGIAGVTDSGDRLVLFMRDRRLLSAELEKSCSTHDFYAGFLVERSEDGRLCVGRDRIQARSGAKCRLSNLSQLVPLEE